MFKKLQKQLMFVCLIGTALVLMVMSVVSLQFAIKQLRSQSEKNFQNMLNNVVINLSSNQIIDRNWLVQMEKSNKLWIGIHSENHELLHNSLSPERKELLEYISHRPEILQMNQVSNHSDEPRNTSFTIKFGKPYQVTAITYPLRNHWITVTMFKDLSEENRQINSLKLVFIFIDFIALILLAIFAWLFTGKAVQPIKENYKKQIDFVSAASHELRSPLAVVQATAGAIRQLTDDQKIIQFTKTIDQECSRLSRLTKDLLSLAEADNSHWSMQLSMFDPETFLLNTWENFESLAVKQQVSISINLPEEPLPKITADQQRLCQLLGILIDNAISHVPENGKIILSTWESGKKVYFSVADNGQGIPPEKRDKIFTRFYQGDDSRTDKEHYGLGLSIATEIVNLHKGKIYVETSVLGGANFIFCIPVHSH